MDDVQKMFQLLVNGQSVMKSDLLMAIQKLDKKIDGVEERLTERIDKIGMQIANLKDDTPTRDEFDDLEIKVTKIEQILAVA